MNRIMDFLFRRTSIPTLNKGLDAAYLRQRSIASNIANAQSAGYKRKVVDFEDMLKKEIGRQPGELLRTHENHLPGRQIESNISAIIRDANDRIDGQGSEEIVIEREMSNLAKTQIQYETEAKLTKQFFELLNSATRGMA